MTRVLPIRSVSSAWPSTLLILWDAGVVQVLALEQDPCAAGMLGEPAHLGQGARPAGVVAVQGGELGDERRVVQGVAVRAVEARPGRR